MFLSLLLLLFHICHFLYLSGLSLATLLHFALQLTNELILLNDDVLELLIISAGRFELFSQSCHSSATLLIICF